MLEVYKKYRVASLVHAHRKDSDSALRMGMCATAVAEALQNAGIARNVILQADAEAHEEATEIENISQRSITAAKII